MAIHDKFLRGAIGNIVFYELNGKQVARIRARKVKMAPVSLARAANFGHAARLSSICTWEIKRMLALPKLPMVQQRLAGEISRWLGTTPLDEISPQALIPSVISFRLNPKTQLDYFLKQYLQVTGNHGENMQLIIPAFRPVGIIAAPLYTSTIRFRLAVVSCNFENPAVQQAVLTEFEIPFNSELLEPQEIDLKVKHSSGALTIAVAALIFKGKTWDTLEGHTELRWQPVEVIGAMYG